MTIDQAAVALGVSRRTVQLLLRDRKLGCHRLGAKGGKVSISQAHLDAYLARAETAPPATEGGGRIPDIVGAWQASRKGVGRG